MADNTSNQESLEKKGSPLWRNSSSPDRYKNRDGEVIDDEFFLEADVDLGCGWAVAGDVGALKFIESDYDLFKHRFANIPLEFRSFFKAPTSPGKRDIILRYKNQRFQATISLLSRMVKYPMLKFSPEFVQIISRMKNEIESDAEHDVSSDTPVMVFEPTDTEGEYRIHFCRMPYKPVELDEVFSEEVKSRRAEEKMWVEQIDEYLIGMFSKITRTQQLYHPNNSEPALTLSYKAGLQYGYTNLSQTDKGIYYLFPYVPTKQKTWKRSEPFLDIATDILHYKNIEEPAFYQYTAALYLGVLELSRIIPQRHIAITGIPRSTYGEESAVWKSIQVIVHYSKMKSPPLLKEHGKDLIDYRKALFRIKSIPVGHRRQFSSNYEKKSSLMFLAPEIRNDNTAYIILDDITTRGDSMLVAKEFLEDNGIDSDNIYMLALSKTVSRYEKL